MIFVDTTCRHCGDPIRRGESGDWAHVIVPGSLLYNCQHTVPYGQRAEPVGEVCPFCPIPADAEIHREWRRSGHVVAFVPLNPVTPGHLLVVPSAHVADLAESPRLTAEVMRCAAEVAAVSGDCNVITSKGAAATQTVRHLHVHVVPRRVGDGLALPWSDPTRHLLREVESLRHRLDATTAP